MNNSKINCLRKIISWMLAKRGAGKWSLLLRTLTFMHCPLCKCIYDFSQQKMDSRFACSLFCQLIRDGAGTKRPVNAGVDFIDLSIPPANARTISGFEFQRKFAFSKATKKWFCTNGCILGKTREVNIEEHIVCDASFSKNFDVAKLENMPSAFCS